MKSSILFNSCLRKEVEIASKESLGAKQFFFIVAIFIFIISPLFYLFCFYFFPNPAEVFAKNIVFLTYICAHIAKYIFLDFIIRPKILKKSKDNFSDSAFLIG